jgi:SNF2 family DNA or RNA helicase
LEQPEIKTEFVAAITEHRVIGYVLSLYLIKPNEKGTFYSVTSNVLKQDMLSRPNDFTDEQKKLITLVDKYSDENLTKRFSKKKSSKEFFQEVKKEFFNEQITPFIDRQIVDCIDIIRNNNIKLFLKQVKYNNVYDADKVEILENKAVPVFHFDLTDEGLRYYLNIYQDGKPIKFRLKKHIMLTDNPCRVILDGKIYSFESMSGKKLKPFFEKEQMSIPSNLTERYLKGFVYNIVMEHDVEATGFDILKTDAEKRVVLSLEQGLNMEPILVLKYQYGKKMFDAGKKGSVEVEFKTINGRYTFIKHQRDLLWEKEVIDFFRERDLILSGNQLLFSKQGNLYDEIFTYAIINWLSRHRHELNERGYVFSQIIPNIKYFIGMQDLNLKMKQENDWFDLYAVVSFGDFKIPFIKLKKNILNGKREFILPNGEIAILPAEWFSRYKELFTFADGKDFSIRFPKHHFQLLKKCLADVDPEFEKRVAALETHTFRLVDEPDGLNAKLRSYQKEGFSWMSALGKNNFGGCLADDMGLGKTLQTLTLLQHNKNNSPLLPKVQVMNPQLDLFANEFYSQPASMIVVPTSLVHNWENEMKKFTPNLKIYKHVGSQRKKVDDFNGVVNYYDVIVTTYGTIRNDVDDLKNITFNYLILDESQNIKNAESKTYQAVTELQAKHKLVLTGTPIENSLSDLWSQMNFLNPGLLGNLPFFKKEFIQPIEKENDEEKQKQLFQLVTPFILRRTKEEVAKDLPPLTEQIRYCEMTEEQSKLYEEQKSIIRNNLLANIEQQGPKGVSFLALQGLTRLRQLANHPALLGNDGTESGKFNEVIFNLSDLMAENHKVLIFSSFVTHLELFRKEFEAQGWDYCLLTGQTTDRESVIRDFQEKPQKKIFLISLKAGGVGLNLTSADYIFILDPWWNPAAESQAVSRAHRIGQNKKVFVYRFISENTIEEKIQNLKERKSALAEKFVQSKNPFHTVSTGEMMDLFD